MTSKLLRALSILVFLLDLASAQDGCADAVTLRECDTDEAWPLYPRSKTNQLVAVFTTKCDHEDVKYRWRIFTYASAEDLRMVEDYVTNHIFVIYPFALPKGFYLTNLTLQVTRRGVVKDLQPILCAFEVTSLDPIATIVGGTERTVGADQSFVVDGSKSVDRDNKIPKLTFKWQCQGPQNFCSKSIRGSSITVPAKHVVKGSKYIFVLSVRNEGSEVWVTTNQTITVLAEAAQLEIVCEKNCPPTSSKTNSRWLTFLRVKCLKGCDGTEETLFRWTIEDQNFDYRTGTQFGQKSDRFIIKEGVLEPGKKYTVRVALEDRAGEAVTILDVGTPGVIQACQVEPPRGKSLQTKFKINCTFTGQAYTFEIFTNTSEKKVVLTKKVRMESVEFLLPANPEVFCKIIDIDGFEDTTKLTVNVEAPSSEEVAHLVESLPGLVKSGDFESVVQFSNAIFEEAPEMKKLLLDSLKDVSIKSQENARQISLLVTKLVYNSEAESDPNQGEVATGLCRRAAEIDLKYVKKEPSPIAYQVKDSAQNLMSCAETDTKANFKVLEPSPVDFEVTTPFPPLPLPVIEEIYPDYDTDVMVVAKRNQYEKSSVNLVGICEANLKMMALVVIEGEDTFVAEAGTSCAQVTKMAGKNLATMEVGFHGGTLKPSRDLEEETDAIDVTVCSWEQDPFWWNPGKEVASTNVVLVKMLRKGEEMREFEAPNRFVFDYRGEEPEVRQVPFGEGSVLRIEVRKVENFYVEFHLMEEVFRVLITHFDKPGSDQVRKKGAIVTGDDNILYQEHSFDHDSWYYVSVVPETNQSASYSVSVYTKSCYSWNSGAKSWQFACKDSPHPDKSKIQCLCPHLSILAGTTYNNVYKVDGIFTNPDFEMVLLSSPVIFITLSTAFALYSFLSIMMVWQRSVRGTKIFIPADISSSSRYVYLVGIITGRKLNSGTSSNICVKLFGSSNGSWSHVLNYPDPQKRIFQRGNTDWFVIPTSVHLGNLNQVALWSDYSGRNPRWFCSNVTVYDLQTDQKWYFEINQWFDLPPNGVVYMKSEVFAGKNKWRLGKVLISVFPKRAHQDGFGTFKRLTILWSILVTIFATCLVLVGVPTLKMSDGFGETYLGVVWIGFASSASTFLVHMVLIWLFRLRFGVRAWFATVAILVPLVVLLVVLGFWVPKATGRLWLASVAVSFVVYFFILENMYTIIVNLFQKSGELAWPKQILATIQAQRALLFRKFGENLLRPYFSHLYQPMDDQEIQERGLRAESRRNFLTMLEDTVMFVCYVTLLYLAIFAQRNTQSVGNHQEMVDLLAGRHSRTQSYDAVRSLPEIYDYVNATLIPTIHAQQWYSKWVVTEAAILADFHNKLLGVARIRQKRITCNTTCLEFWQSDQDVAPFGEAGLPRLAQIWNYTLAKDAGYTVYVGKFGTYFGGGFVAPLGRTWYNSYANLVYLKNSSWLDPTTRVVFIEFLVYNVNSNLFNSVRIVFERSATGFLRSSLDVSTAQFVFVKDEQLVVQVVLLSSFVLVVGIFSLKVLVRLFKSRLVVLKDLWTLVDLVIIGMSYSCFALFLHRAESVGRFLHQVETSKKNEFINYFNLVDEDVSFTLVAAFLVFVATIRLWKVCRFGPVFRTMEKTLILSFPPLLVILLTHVIVSMAFALSGYLIFSHLSRSFRDIPETLVTLVLLQMGLQDDFDFEGFMSSNPVLSRFYYSLYMIASIIYLTIYVAVIMICYEEANDLVSSEESDFLRNVRQEVGFYKASFKIALARLRGGYRSEKQFVAPKPDAVRYAKCMTLSSETLEQMTCVAILDLNKFVWNEAEKEGLMRRIVGSLEDSDRDYIFFNEKAGSNRVKIVDDYRIRRVAAAVEMILNSHEEIRKQRHKRYKKAVEQQLNKLYYFVQVLKTIVTVVSNIEVE